MTFHDEVMDDDTVSFASTEIYLQSRDSFAKTFEKWPKGTNLGVWVGVLSYFVTTKLCVSLITTVIVFIEKMKSSAKKTFFFPFFRYFMSTALQER